MIKPLDRAILKAKLMAQIQSGKEYPTNLHTHWLDDIDVTAEAILDRCGL